MVAYVQAWRALGNLKNPSSSSFLKSSEKLAAQKLSSAMAQASEVAPVVWGAGLRTWRCHFLRLESFAARATEDLKPLGMILSLQRLLDRATARPLRNIPAGRRQDDLRCQPPMPAAPAPMPQPMQQQMPPPPQMMMDDDDKGKVSRWQIGSNSLQVLEQVYQMEPFPGERLRKDYA